MPLAVSDLGRAGLHGFIDKAPRRFSFHRSFKGGHDDVIALGQHRSLARLIVKAEDLEPKEGMRWMNAANTSFSCPGFMS